MTEEFLAQLDEEMLDYFRDMVNVLVERFGVSRAEAVARINAMYGADEEIQEGDLMGHEMPEFWAYGLYFEPSDDARPMPSGRKGEDLAGWQPRPAPPKSSPVWTLPNDDH
ncbi:hypothetical protein [Streptomyces sp. NPDC059009]|uniref:hypothetical protein n=1 Tax=Streptomyces sp. NPDC059009 TaxID=3346694 RepID=UPI003675649B